MDNKVFVGLHNHSCYSLMDSISLPEDMVKKTKELGMDAIAITEHGSLASHFQMKEAGKKYGVKIIFGVEAYFMDNVRLIEQSNDRVLELEEEKKNLKKDKAGKAKLDEIIRETKQHKKTSTEYYHLILLAKNYQGYQNLVKIHNAGVLDGFYGKPRIDWEVLEKYRGGLIASSACLGGKICKRIESDEMDAAISDIARFKSIFGKDFYLELQLNDIKIQYDANMALIKLAEITDTPLNITTDTHYVEQEEAKTRSLLYSLNAKPKKDDGPTDVVNDSFMTDLFIKNEHGLLAAWEKYMPDVPNSILGTAIKNTRKISDSIQSFELDTSLKFPIFDTSGETQEDYLSKIAWKGLADKKLSDVPGYKERLQKELNTITKLGFAAYFNVVGDMILHAKKHQSVGLGRGSAAGSLLSYVVGITDVDPIKWELYFERFLDESKGVVAPTFGIKNLIEVQIDYTKILSDCACNQH